MVGGAADLKEIGAEINRIGSLSLDALRNRWRVVFGRTASVALPKDLLVRMLTYRIQEKALGALPVDSIRLLDSLGGDEKRAPEGRRRLKPGTVLVREYQGERHTVTVVPDGYVWHSITYRSLSMIARAITGTAWGGPRFFGLRESGSRNADLKSRTNGRADPPVPVSQVFGQGRDRSQSSPEAGS